MKDKQLTEYEWNDLLYEYAELDYASDKGEEVQRVEHWIEDLMVWLKDAIEQRELEEKARCN